jgi:hypothetical protein
MHGVMHGVNVPDLKGVMHGVNVPDLKGVMHGVNVPDLKGKGVMHGVKNENRLLRLERKSLFFHIPS